MCCGKRKSVGLRKWEWEVVWMDPTSFPPKSSLVSLLPADQLIKINQQPFA
ncbi:hypothetical protein CHISP_3446 [Chitinispirillum alkaliphilum]|nr:hypothetical protein CHISP_3446 [Chitinispirillum alkaliphilum]